MVKSLLVKTGFRVLACFGGFDGRFLDGEPGLADEHVYVAAAR